MIAVDLGHASTLVVRRRGGAVGGPELVRDAIDPTRTTTSSTVLVTDELALVGDLARAVGRGADERARVIGAADPRWPLLLLRKVRLDLAADDDSALETLVLTISDDRGADEPQRLARAAALAGFIDCSAVPVSRAARAAVGWEPDHGTVVDAGASGTRVVSADGGVRTLPHGGQWLDDALRAEFAAQQSLPAHLEAAVREGRRALDSGRAAVWAEFRSDGVREWRLPASWLAARFDEMAAAIVSALDDRTGPVLLVGGLADDPLLAQAVSARLPGPELLVPSDARTVAARGALLTQADPCPWGGGDDRLCMQVATPGGPQLDPLFETSQGARPARAQRTITIGRPGQSHLAVNLWLRRGPVDSPFVEIEFALPGPCAVGAEFDLEVRLDPDGRVEVVLSDPRGTTEEYRTSLALGGVSEAERRDLELAWALPLNPVR